MKTQLLYLDDTYCLSGKAQLVASGTDERGPYLVLDQTLFYPQGGGQPADRGFISAEGVTLEVQFVGFVDGAVRHYISALPEALLMDTPVQLDVDKASRLLHAQLHTSGHLIAALLHRLVPELQAVKGHHFTDSAYVEFEGEALVDLPTLTLEVLQNEIDRAINRNLALQSRLLGAEELVKLNISLPPSLPKGKTLRIVTIEGFEPVPCGGTHVRSTGELSGLTVTKCKVKRGRVRVSYAMA